MSDQAVDITEPAGTDAPSTIDDQIRELKIGLRDRFDVDHYLPLSGNLWTTETNDGGKHRRVVFVDPLGSAPTIGTSEGGLYTYDVSSKAELHWKDEDGNVKQITSAGLLNLSTSDMDEIIDGTTLYTTGGAVSVQLDDTTIEYDATNKVQIKTPASDGDSDAVAAPVMAYGHYDGDGTDDRDIDLDITPWKIVVKSISSGDNALVLMKYNSGTWTFQMNTGADRSDEATISGTNLRVSDSDRANKSGYSYIWWAIGARS